MKAFAAVRWVTLTPCRAAVMVPFWHECHSCSSDQFHVQFPPTSWLLSMDLGLAWLLGLFSGALLSPSP